MTISLSNVIKKDYTGQLEGKKISIRYLTVNHKIEQERTNHIYTESQIMKENYIKQAMLEAEEIVKQAKLEANKIKQQIEQEKVAFEEEKQKAFEQARTQGFETGVNEGRAKGYEEVNDSIQFAKSIVDQARIEYMQCVEKSEQTILTLSLKAAEKILREQLQESGSSFLSIVKQAIEEVKDYKEIKLYVHPNQYELLVENKGDLIPYFHEGQMYIYPNENLTEFGCVIETDGIRIDASIDMQLQELKRKLLDLFSGDDL